MRQVADQPRQTTLLRRPQELLWLTSRGVAAPLEDLPRAAYPAKDLVLRSWRFLAAVRAADENVLFHLLILLIESVPDRSFDGGVPALPLEWCARPTLIRPTEAHPRAYKGTKRQPPKQAGLPQIDLRPHLCDPGSLRAVLSPLRQFFASARIRLIRAGYSGAVLDAIEDDSRKGWTLPPPFARYLWPRLRWQTPREVSRWLSIYKSLNAGDDGDLLATLSQLLAISEPAGALAWSYLALTLPAPRRGPFLDAVIETEASALQPANSARAQLDEISGLATDQQFTQWSRCFLEAVRERRPTGFLLSGIRLSAHYSPEYSFHRPGQCDGTFPEKLVEEIAGALSSNWLAMALWDRCGHFPGFAEATRAAPWRHLTADAAREYFDLLLSSTYAGLTEAGGQLRWQAIRQQLPLIDAVLLDTPAPYQLKACVYLSVWLRGWNDPKFIARRMPAALRLMRHLAAEPFSRSARGPGAIGSLLDAKLDVIVDGFLAAPDGSFGALERACRRANDAILIYKGLDTLVQTAGEFVVNCFQDEPKRLLRTARLLGGLPGPVQSQIARSCLRRSVAGGQALSLLELLELIEKSVMVRLQERLPAAPLTKSNRHALRLLGSLRENRKGLRNFLRAWWSGDHDYLSRHPLTLAWHRRHPAIPRDLWQEGLRVISPDGELTIGIERDPLEILKLGTYAGTCLGIGGLCADSAAATLLDANKRVVYARNRRGVVAARQLIAIADDDRLVCFNVYPLSWAASLKSLFSDYDRAFAAAIGVQLYVPRDSTPDDYTISSVLSNYWWDDSSWDFRTQE